MKEGGKGNSLLHFQVVEFKNLKIYIVVPNLINNLLLSSGKALKRQLLKNFPASSPESFEIKYSNNLESKCVAYTNMYEHIVPSS